MFPARKVVSDSETEIQITQKKILFIITIKALKFMYHLYIYDLNCVHSYLVNIYPFEYYARFV